MHRYLAPGALLCLGSFLLFMSLVVAPRPSRVPLNRYAVVESQGTGSYLSRAQGTA